MSTPLSLAMVFYQRMQILLGPLGPRASSGWDQVPRASSPSASNILPETSP